MPYKDVAKRKRSNYENNRKRYHRMRTAILARFGNRCARCGFSDERALQIDHIYGGGAKEISSISADVRYTRLLKMSEEELHSSYQLLCANCNWIKRRENGEERRANALSWRA